MLSISTDQSWFNTPNNVPIAEYVSYLMNNNHPSFIKTIKFRGIITPHAGITYSGSVSATMYNCLLANARQSRFKNLTFLVLCTNHYSTSNRLILPTASSIDFNRHRMTFNMENINDIYDSGPDVEYNSDAFTIEHSFFNQLPFISHVINQLSSKNVSILPIIVGTHTISSNMEKVIKGVVNRQNTYTIISTDFNHVGPRFGTQLPSGVELKKMDLKAVDHLINKKYRELEREFSVCGAKALILYDKIKKLVPSDLQLIIRKTSNDVEKSSYSIVSYLGFVIS